MTTLLSLILLAALLVSAPTMARLWRPWCAPPYAWLAAPATARAGALVFWATIIGGWATVGGACVMLLALLVVAGPLLDVHAGLRRRVLGMVSAYPARRGLLRYLQMYLLVRLTESGHAPPSARSARSTPAPESEVRHD